MANQILVPSLGESVTEATVSKWLKSENDNVEADEPLVELETDKVNIEVPSPLSGTLSKISVKEGNTVAVGAILGLVSGTKSTKSEADDEGNEHDKKTYVPPKTAAKENVKKTKKKIDIKSETLKLVDESEEKGSNGALVLDTLVQEDIEEKKEYIPPKTKKHLSPSVKKIVEEQNIDVSNIEGSGPKGNIIKSDLLNLMGNMPQPSKRKITHGTEEKVKMSRLRITIAKRLKEAQDTAAMLTTFNEVNVQNIIQMRTDYQEDFQKKYSVKLGFMSFFVKASVVALKNFPAVNAEIEKSILYIKIIIIFL